MKIEVDVKDIREMIYGLKRTCMKKPTFSALNDIYVKANGGIHFWTTDFDTYIKSSPKGKIHEPGEASFRLKEFDKVLRKLNKHGGMLSIETDGEWIEFSHSKMDFRMQNSVEDYPDLPPRCSCFNAMTPEFREELGRVAAFYSDGGHRQNIQHVHFLTKGDDLVVESTDGHRLAQWTFAGEGLHTPESLPTETFGHKGDGGTGFMAWGDGVECATYILGRSKTRGDKVYLGFSEWNDWMLCIKFGRFEVYTTIPKDCTYPDLTYVIPAYCDRKPSAMSSDYVKNAIDLVSIFASPKTYNITLSHEPDEQRIVLRACDADRGEGEAEFTIIPGKDKRRVKCAMNYKYLEDAVDTLDCSVIHYDVSDTLSPFLMWPSDEPDKLMVVMPMGPQ